MPQTKSAVRKALIPIAGKGTRLMPITSAVPKALFPLVDGNERIYAVLHFILKEPKSAGIEQIGIIVNPKQIEILEHYFDAAKKIGFNDLPSQIEYIVQPSSLGFGDAVLQGSEFVGDESFLLLLGDHVYLEDRGKQTCVAQVVQAFDSTSGVAMIGVQQVQRNELSKVGVARGVQIQQGIYHCTNFVEKPNIMTAQRSLVTPGLPKGTFLAHCGIYIFSPEIFDYLLQVSSRTQNASKEIELAEAQALLLEKYPEKYFLYKIAGRAYDTGTPTGYAAAQAAFRSRGKLDATD